MAGWKKIKIKTGFTQTIHSKACYYISLFNIKTFQNK